MNAKEFEREITYLTPFGEGALDQRTRILRAAGLLPYGARGRNAPQMPAYAATNVLLSLAAESATDAAKTVMTYASMVEIKGSFIGGTFGETLTQILQNSHNTLDVKELRICRSWPQALIARKDDQTILFGPGEGLDRLEQFGAYIEITFRASVLTQLALGLSGEERGPAA